MFKHQPKLLGHRSIFEFGNFITPEYILNHGNNYDVNLFHRFCPHRRYPLSENYGIHIKEITCKFHNFQWSEEGVPLNNNKKLKCGSANIGRSGLIFKDFIEPDHKWVNDLQKEEHLNYSHSSQGSSKGSWLWLMDIEADLLHIHNNNGIHPFLSSQISLNDIILEQGNGWILQNHPFGWWLYIYPYSCIEYGYNGKLRVNYIIPHDVDSEFGFDWITQFYYDSDIDCNDRLIFETLDDVFEEDVAAIELQKGKYFPLINPINQYEDHCVHWGQWVIENKIK